MLPSPRVATRGLPEPPMLITVTCPSCGQRLKAKDTLAGRLVPCPKCGVKLSIPQAEAETAVYTLQAEPEPKKPPPAAPEPEESGAEERVTPRPTARRQKAQGPPVAPAAKQSSG